MRNAIAFANNDIIMVAWSYGEKPDGCMGFAIHRIDTQGKETALPSHAVFKGEEIKPGQTTDQHPIQKFYWKDPYARLVGEQTGSFTFRYKIIPLQGTPGNLVPMRSLPILTSNEVELTSKCSDSLSATFNRGLISTQHVSHALDNHLDLGGFLTDIRTEGNQLRKDLTGDTLGTLLKFLHRVDHSGEIYAALYELTDSQLVDALAGLGKKLNVVMADIASKPAGTEGSSKAAQPAKDGSKQPENQHAWTLLSKSAKAAFYRLPPHSHIVHNKFLIYVDGKGKAQAVLTGSTNWTPTGLCAQTNNVLVIDDSSVAARYLKYWNILKADQIAHQKDPKSFQAAAMRSFDSKRQDFTLDKQADGDGVTPSALTSYLSPNTPKQRSKSKKTAELQPIDMKDLAGRIRDAKHAVLFLAFIPGTPSIVDFASAAQKANKDLFVRGCVTSPDAAGEFYYTLRGTSPPKRQRLPKGQPKPLKTPVKEDPRVIAAKALTKADAPAGWVPELLKAGFAITHDKIVVIDPFADNCTVVTGSHNLGYEASYNNDENLVIIEGNKKLAMAYATHVLDVYDHFAWRWTLNDKGKPTDDSYLKSTPDEWLDWYFDANGEIKTAQLKFWMQATV